MRKPEAFARSECDAELTRGDKPKKSSSLKGRKRDEDGGVPP